jgi:ankyrin repeat protein
VLNQAQSKRQSKNLTPRFWLTQIRTTGTHQKQEQTTMSDVSEMIKSIRNNDVAQVKLLLLSDSIDLIDDNPISCASSRGFTEIVQLLLNDGRADPTDDSNYALYIASKNGHIEVVRLLLQWSSGTKRVDPTADDNCAIRIASENGHIEIVLLLLQDPRVDPSADGNQAIRYASENGHVEVVRLLLEDPRVDPSVRDNYAIMMASKNGHVDVVQLLLQDPRVTKNQNQNQNQN